MYQHILIPVDDSETSRHALDQALRFCGEQCAQVRLLHVVDLAQFSWGGTEFVDVAPMQKSLKAAGQQLLQSAKARLAEQGIEATAAMLEIWGGGIAKAIVEDARAWPADLIVMGSHGRSGLDHLLLGSVAEGVVRHSPIPVLLYPNVERQ